MKFVICPSHCQKEGIVLGRGIHHPSSNICAAAIADGTIPKHGGCVAISRVAGLENYSKSKMSNGVKVTSGKDGSFSIITTKADSSDFSKSDIRILNHKGEPDY
jgi:hypothetical protein